MEAMQVSASIDDRCHVWHDQRLIKRLETCFCTSATTGPNGLKHDAYAFPGCETHFGNILAQNHVCFACAVAILSCECSGPPRPRIVPEHHAVLRRGLTQAQLVDAPSGTRLSDSVLLFVRSLWVWNKQQKEPICHILQARQNSDCVGDAIDEVHRCLELQ